MVLALVLLPSLAKLINDPADASDGGIGRDELLMAVGVTLGKVATFVILTLLVGRRVIPWIFQYIAQTGSRELFRLAVLAIALGIAFGAAELFDPSILLRDPLPVLATFLIIVAGKSIAALLIVLAFRHPLSTALTISASLAQIGEFSFILVALGVSLGLLPTEGQELVITGAILSILANPLFFLALEKLRPWVEKREIRSADGIAAAFAPNRRIPETALSDHAVLVGFGRVGSLVADALRNDGRPPLIIEERPELVEQARARDMETIQGNAAQPEVVAAANLAAARWLCVAIPNAFEAGQIVAQTRSINAALDIVARAHSDAEVEHLSQRGANFIIMGEREIARGMVEHVFGSRSPAVAAAESSADLGSPSRPADDPRSA